MKRIACTAILLAALASGAAGEEFDPAGFRIPFSPADRSLLADPDTDPLLWSHDEIGPDVCAGEDALIHVRLGKTLFRIPCARYVFAMVAAGKHRKNWGRDGDPVIADKLLAILRQEPPVALAIGRPDAEAPGAADASDFAHCDVFGKGMAICTGGTAGPGRKAILPDGAPERGYILCEETAGQAYCEWIGRGGEAWWFGLYFALPALTPAGIETVLPLQAKAAALAWEWARP
ncbi:MAG: hypothetical protein D6754_02460 [Alphaproteobacteria bacterium]|nr:MAG: hypothetical protein D6754_02460 [Alphaproteobacteria bacterium]